jgi:predicted dehydrogenase
VYEEEWMLRVGLVGCGAVGRRRAGIVAADEGARLVVASDLDSGRAAALAGDFGAEAADDWRAVVERADIDAVIVSASNDTHAPVGLAALAAGKHLLVEKPLARTPEEAAELVMAAERAGRTLQTGFNHRWYPSIQHARRLVDEGAIGQPIMARCRYGHGGRRSWPSEWFTRKEISGGGTFLDNGVHALDLFRWFLGDFAEATGMVATLAWEVACEDNGVGAFRTADGRLALLHSSWTQWDPVFSFELFGREGFIHVTSRESLTLGGRGAVIGPVPTQTWTTPGPNVSFDDDWREFAAAIREGRPPLTDGRAGLEAVRMAYAVYEASATGRTVRL